MKIVFISSFQYPFGTATTNRHLSYGRGLAELGHSVHFLLLYPQNSVLYKENVLVYNGILLECFNLSNVNNRLTNFKKIFLLPGWIRTAKDRLIEIQRNEHIDVLVLLDTSAVALNPFLRIGKRLKIKLFHESTEFPFIFAGNSILRRLDLFFYLRDTIRKFDGIFVISKTLAMYFTEKTHGQVRIKIINMAVEPDRFQKKGTQCKPDYDYIAYCGSMYGDKDGLNYLIEAFRRISKEWPDLRLVIIGDNSDAKRFEPIQQLVDRSNLTNKVVFTGFVPRDHMPDLLNNARILALARPNNRQAEGGFPIKLGEYLATGKPVVITSTGEITNFLKDGVNAYIAIPGDAEDFANKLRQALSNYNAALKIGQEGYKLVQGAFNYKTQSRQLSQFIEEILHA